MEALQTKFPALKYGAFFGFSRKNRLKYAVSRDGSAKRIMRDGKHQRYREVLKVRESSSLGGSAKEAADALRNRNLFSFWFCVQKEEFNPVVPEAHSEIPKNLSSNSTIKLINTQLD